MKKGAEVQVVIACGKDSLRRLHYHVEQPSGDQRVFLRIRMTARGTAMSILVSGLMPCRGASGYCFDDPERWRMALLTICWSRHTCHARLRFLSLRRWIWICSHILPQGKFRPAPFVRQPYHRTCRRGTLTHLVGKGRMEEPDKIVAVLEDFFASQTRRKKIVIPAGPTYEKMILCVL